MNNEPEYKIHGLDRRKMKKELSLIKSFIRDFWHDHTMDKDMASFYGGSVMSDSDAQTIYDRESLNILEIENMLNVPYKSLAEIRDEKIDLICQ